MPHTFESPGETQVFEPKAPAKSRIGEYADPMACENETAVINPGEGGGDSGNAHQNPPGTGQRRG